jgi:uncharacterized membrane protein YjgN (DUF898 family)
MQKHQFEFTGSGWEYFKIWIVNLLLTIMTLGIYSAWAKVRRNQYFYRNTHLAGAGFDYHGKPLAILIGRLIIVAFYFLYVILINVSPAIAIAILIVGVLLVPVLIQKSFRFKLHNSSYRGLRFKFAGGLGGAYQSFMLWPILTPFTLYLLAPFAHQRIKQYQHGNSMFGQTRFSFKAGAGSFYGVYALTLLLLILIGVGVAIAASLMGIATLSGASPATMILVGGLIYLTLIVAMLLVGPYFSARIQNLIWNGTLLGEHQFQSKIQARQLLALYVTNFLGIIFTLGLFKPFATIRLLRYRLSCMTLIAASDLNHFVADQSTDDVSALGEGASDIFEFDIAL